jgi:hypothetical protein
MLATKKVCNGIQKRCGTTAKYKFFEMTRRKNWENAVCISLNSLTEPYKLFYQIAICMKTWHWQAPDFEDTSKCFIEKQTGPTLSLIFPSFCRY